MAWPLIAAAALSAAETVGNNVMSEWHADKAQERQKELEQIQFNHNMALQRSALPNQVQSAKLAGLNPAMFNGHMAAAQSVSQGSAPKAENVESVPSDVLLMAQARNLEADTAKKQSETKNVNEDTELKFAQRLFTGANQARIEEETQQIKNTNDQYADTNRGLAEFGRGMAEKWQTESWYSRLAPQTRDTIDALASGDMPLTVGGMVALERTIDAQRNLSDADRALIKNAFDNAVTEAMFSDEAVMQAISREPKNVQDKLLAERDRIMADTEKIKYKMKELIDSELAGKQLSNEQLQAVIQSFKRGDLNYLKSQGEYGKWLEGYAEEMLLRIFPIVSGASVHGALTKPPSPQQSHGEATTGWNWHGDETRSSPIYGPNGEVVRQGGTMRQFMNNSSTNTTQQQGWWQSPRK